jgi:hypothetical protein
MRCLLVAGEVVLPAIDLIEEELAGLRLGLQHVEANVPGLLPALASVVEGGLKEGISPFRHDAYRDADNVHGTHLAEPSAISNQRPARFRTARQALMPSVVRLNADR